MTTSSSLVRPEASTQRVLVVKNALRGVLGRFKSRAYAPERIDPAPALVIALRRILVAARSQLTRDEAAEFLPWLDDQLQKQIAFRELPSSYKYLDGVFDAEVLDFGDELRWAVARVGRYADELSDFRAAAREYSLAFESGDLQAAEAALADIEGAYGPSLWLVQAGIALRQAKGGLEAQKQYAEDVRAKAPRSVLSYITFHTSIRNEPAVSWGRYGTEVTDNIARLNMSEDIKRYLRYRLAREMPATGLEAATLLRVEYSHTIIDIYETLLDVLLHGRDTFKDTADLAAVEAATRALVAIRDERLEALRAPEAATSPMLARSSGRLLMAGDFRAAGRAARRRLTETLEPWELVIAAASFPDGARKHRDSDQLPLRLLGQLSISLAGGADHSVALAELRKFAVNHRAVRAGAFLDRLVHQLSLPAHEGPRSLVGADRELAGESAGWASMPYAPGADVLSPEAAALFNGLASFRQGDAAGLEHLQVAEASGSPVVRAQAADAHLGLLIRLDRWSEAMEVLADVVASGGADEQLPADRIVGGRTWRDLRPHADRLALPIALHLLWRQEGDDRVATLLRFSFSEFLKRRGVTRPSELVSGAVGLQPDHLTHFLREICIASVMDMHPSFPTSRAVEEERISVLEALQGCDPARADEYQDEIVYLQNRLTIAEGVAIVDSSRVHVDTDALMQWAKRELAEPFARYRRLVEAGVGLADDLSVVLRQLVGSDSATRNSLAVPDNEADALLVQIVRRLRDEFLFHPDHGLDSYLSKRVRHHPLTAALRAAFEFQHLITQRDTEHGRYRPNTEWLDRLRTLNAGELRQASEAFTRFSKRFDDAMTELKDQRFHIRSAEKPAGLFQLNLEPVHHQVIRSVVQMDSGLEDVVQTCFVMFWGLLEASLQEVRATLNGSVKTEVASMIDALRADMRACAENDPVFPMLSAGIGDASGQAQRKLSEVAEWFRRREVHEAARLFTLREIIDIGVDATLRAQASFRPAVEIDIGEEILLLSPNLALIADVLRVTIDNVRHHSGVDVGQRIRIFCSADLAARVVRLEISSRVADHVRTPETERRLKDLRASIAEGRFDRVRVRREGGSGFVKVASLVRQSPEGRLDFGFEEDGFRVAVDLALILPPSDTPPAA